MGTGAWGDGKREGWGGGEGNGETGGGERELERGGGGCCLSQLIYVIHMWSHMGRKGGGVGGAGWGGLVG